MAASSSSPRDPAVRLLIADAATVPRPAATNRHHHAFWQLDHCDGGTIAAELPSGPILLRRHHGLLLPPGTPHAFRYQPGSRYVSWKFTWDGAGPAATVLAAQPGWRGLAQALSARPAAAAVPHLLAAAMRLAGAPQPAVGLDADVARLVEAHPARAWSVAAVARILGLSPGHLSARFRATAGMPLKRWLDVRRAEHAAQALAAGELAIGDVAARCGFADQFSFSRFFRRVTGDSPSTFRSRRPR